MTDVNNSLVRLKWLYLGPAKAGHQRNDTPTPVRLKPDH